MNIDKRISFIGGAGAMGSAIIKRLAGSGQILPSALAAVDIDPVKLSKMAKEIGVSVTTEVEVGMDYGHIVILAVKP
ncbi:MAG: NAD(P)-binding domain-containing protein, partial [bacterium]|nr:NAD(P)-binding domain-containing protein [bacterium]